MRRFINTIDAYFSVNGFKAYVENFPKTIENAEEHNGVTLKPVIPYFYYKAVDSTLETPKSLQDYCFIILSVYHEFTHMISSLLCGKIPCLSFIYFTTEGIGICLTVSYSSHYTIDLEKSSEDFDKKLGRKINYSIDFANYISNMIVSSSPIWFTFLFLILSIKHAPVFVIIFVAVCMGAGKQRAQYALMMSTADTKTFIQSYKKLRSL
jgi:hypothetical protein